MRDEVSSSKPALGDNDTFVTLMAAARVHPDLAQSLLAILGLPSFQRQSILNSIIEEMALKSEAADLIGAVAALRDDDVSAKVAEMLRST